jgi:PAS domain S-box-containing protein
MPVKPLSGEQPRTNGGNVHPAASAWPPSEQRFRETFAQTADGLAVVDLAGRFLLVNPAYCAITGYSEAELLATDFLTITHPDDRADNLHINRQLVAGDVSSFDVEKRYVRKNGEVVWVLNSISLCRDDQGRPSHCVALCQDITRRKQAEEERDRFLVREREARAEAEAALRALEESRAALRASEQQYRSLADLVPGVVWTARPDGWVDYANQFWIGFTGLTLEQTYGWGWCSALHADDLSPVTTVWTRAVQAGEQVDVEYRVRRGSDGVYRWFLARGIPVRDPDGQVVKWFGTLTDIDDQKRLAEERTLLLAREQKARVEVEAALRTRDETLQALAASEEQYRILAEVMPQCIWTAGPDGQTDYVNQHWCHYSGLTAEQSLGAGWAAVLHPDDQQKCFAAWTHAVQIGDTFECEYRLQQADGAYRWFLGRGLPVRDREGRVVKWLGTATDIDDQKRVEKELQHQHGLARLLHEVTVAAYQAATVEEALQIGLDQVCAYTGWPVGHVYLLAGEGPPELVPTTIWHLDHPEHFEGFRQVTAGTRIAPGAGLPGRVLAEKKPIWITDVTRDENFPRAKVAANLGVEGAFAFPVLTVGGVVAVLEFFTSEPREPDETLLHALLDIGIQLGHVFERKRADAALQEAKQAAEAANRAKSEFLSRMSHELRTPLNAILGFTQLLEMGSPSPRQRLHLEQILKGGQHLLELINEVLDLARIEAGRIQLSLEPIRVRHLCAEVRDLIQPLAEQRGIHFAAPSPLPLSHPGERGAKDPLSPGWERRRGEGAPCGEEPDLYVLADNQRLKQVLLNLVSNAVKYNREQGSVTLTWEELPPGRVRLSVRDTGPGLPPEKRDRLFNPFDRLGAEATAVEGTGLGLVLSKRLTEAMGGTLSFTSTVGQGTTFFVELPKVTGALEQLAQRRAAAAPAPAQASPASRTVLYIEDNLDNLALIEGIVAYRPQVRLLSAMQGGLGLDLARQHHPDVILLDVHLPDMQGDEVLRQLQADPRLRGTPVVVISADATPSQAARLCAAGASAYLAKPIDVARFLTLLDQLLPVGGVNA